MPSGGGAGPPVNTSNGGSWTTDTRLANQTVCVSPKRSSLKIYVNDTMGRESSVSRHELQGRSRLPRPSMALRVVPAKATTTCTMVCVAPLPRSK